MFGMAGLFDIWKKDGRELKTFTIITTTPNKLVSEVHDRMPVILKSKEDEYKWLNPKVTENDRLLPLLGSYPAKDMEVREASRGINKPGSGTP